MKFETAYSFQISNFRLRSTKGFTLIELLVVISIVTILITFGLTSFSTAQKKARNTKVRSDLTDIRSASEQYYSVCGYNYPLPSGRVTTSGIVCNSPSIAIMPQTPLDPRGTPYLCSPCSSSEYTVCGTLEDETPATYCVNSQQ